MNAPKKHHYTPIFYLKRWVGEDGRLQTFKNIRDNIVRGRVSPEHTGFEYHLYSYSENFLTDNRAEMEKKFFSPLDDKGAIIVEKTISGQELDERERILWAQFILTMKIRTPENVER